MLWLNFRIECLFLIQVLCFASVARSGSNSSDDNLKNVCRGDDLVRNLLLQMETLNFASKNLTYQLDEYSLRVKDDIQTLKWETLQALRSSLGENSRTRKSYGHLIDHRASGDENEVTQPSMKRIPQNCIEAMEPGNKSGVYLIQLPNSKFDPFYVYCLDDPNNGDPWTVVQRRQDGKMDFYRDWQDYKYGFGNVNTEFFVGLDNLYALTHSAVHELWVQMEDFEGNKRFAKYENFAIGNEDTKYALIAVGKYSGSAGDSFEGHEGFKFTTKDRDNDNFPTNCAVDFTGAWWYDKCHKSNLNGKYLQGSYGQENFGKGINWFTWHGHLYSLKYVHMALRPVK